MKRRESRKAGRIFPGGKEKKSEGMLATCGWYLSLWNDRERTWSPLSRGERGDPARGELSHTAKNHYGEENQKKKGSRGGVM